MRLLGGDVVDGDDVPLQFDLVVPTAVVYRDTDQVVAMATFLFIQDFCRKYIFRSLIQELVQFSIWGTVNANSMLMKSCRSVIMNAYSVLCVYVK